MSDTADVIEFPTVQSAPKAGEPASPARTARAAEPLAPVTVPALGLLRLGGAIRPGVAAGAGHHRCTVISRLVNVVRV